MLQPSRRETRVDKDTWAVFVTPPPVFALPTVVVYLTNDQHKRYCKWRDRGLLMQDALPELSSSQREMLMTGLSDADFHRFAGND